MSIHSVKEGKNWFKSVIGLALNSIILLLFASACTSSTTTNPPMIESTENIASPVPPGEPAFSLVTPMRTVRIPSQSGTITPPDTLGSVQYLNYSYSLIHDFDYDACTSDPYVCPDIYYARLTDVHNWMYVQPGETFQLAFELEGEYQIKPSETPNDCQATQDTQKPNLIAIMCRNSGEYILKFNIENAQTGVLYPLYLNLFSVPERISEALIIPPQLSIEEYELVRQPETDTRFFESVIGSTDEILAKHESERGTLMGIANAADLENGDLLQAELTHEPGITNITITQNGNEIFITKAPVLANESFLGLWTLKDHWFIEVVQLAKDSFRSLTRGEIFRDGQSLNELNGYTESFGFQLIHGKPFYFFERDGGVGIFYDDHEIPLEYARVLHYGCCSAGVLNPIKYENMVGFFAVHEDKWYYVEIGVFEDK